MKYLCSCQYQKQKWPTFEQQFTVIVSWPYELRHNISDVELYEQNVEGKYEKNWYVLVT